MKLVIFFTLVVVIACVAANDEHPRVRCRKSEGEILAVPRRHVCEWKCSSHVDELPQWTCERPAVARCACDPELDFCRKKSGKCRKMKKLMG